MEFPFLEKNTRLGSLVDVKIPVHILTKLGYQRVSFLLDTGADFSMLPRHIVEWVGLDLSTCRKGKSYGIEGGPGVHVWLGSIRVKI